MSFKSAEKPPLITIPVFAWNRLTSQSYSSKICQREDLATLRYTKAVFALFAFVHKTDEADNVDDDEVGRSYSGM